MKGVGGEGLNVNIFFEVEILLSGVEIFSWGDGEIFVGL